jgi:peptidyl-prolyl cis-trans isomerase B (cyclophilin B)
MVKIHTNHGVITLELNADKTSATVANFLEYAKSWFYDSTIFHWVVKGLMIQCGGMEPSLKEKPIHEPIINEADNGLSNAAGTAPSLWREP